MEPVFFESPEALRDWFAAHAATAKELLVGFHKTHTGRAGLTWPQSVDEALCVGWIDGVRKSIDAERYQIRFTPRKPGSHWSAVNIRRVPELEREGRMQAAGLAAFAARTEARSARASHEQPHEALVFSAADLKRFRQHKAAWTFFSSTAPSYQRKAIWLVISAKKPETRERRLTQLIDGCSQGIRVWD